MIKKNRKWNSLIELSVIMLIVPILTLTFSNIAIKWLKIFKEAQMYAVVIKNNSTFLKWLWGIRFANSIEWLDNSTDRWTIKLWFWEDKEIKFIWDNWSTSNDDVLFFNENWDEIYLYDKEILKFEKFKPIQLNDSINRKWIRFYIKFWLSWKDNIITATRFWKDSEFFLEYPITYTLRNNK